jgi:ketosteroid isomerase-like protein
MVVDPQTSTAIDAAAKNFADLFKRGEFAAAAAAFADDAVLLPPGPEIVAGRANIQAYWDAGGAIQEMVFEPASRKAIGDGVVREAGALKLWANGQGQRPREISCKYVLVWQKLDESWKMESCIWNRVADPSGAAQQPRRAGQGGGQGRLQGGVGGGGQGRFQPGVGGGQGGGQGRFQGGGGQGRFQPGVGGGQGRYQGGIGGGGQGVGGQGGRFRGGHGQGGQGQGGGQGPGGQRGPGQGGQGQGGGPRGQGRGGRGGGGGVGRNPEPFTPRVDD